MNQTNVQRNFKDTVFRMLFREKENLLGLYNALKHQSTYNPNMPLRDLFYVSRVLQRRIKDENLYSSKLVRIPAPRFVVFYNGTDFQPEQQVLRLSDAFEKKQDQPALELTVIVYNINLGHNQELLETCSLLKEYAQYVEQVRTFAKAMDFPEAVERAVDYCIRNGILADFLSENRAEAIAVSIFEYDEEKHIRSERKEWREIGHAEGLEEGEARALQLMQKLTESDKAEEMARALSDPAYREQLYREYGL